MTLVLNDSHMFLAYHIRSSFLSYESALRDVISDWGLSLEHFYILRYDWKSPEAPFAEISAHALLPKEQALQALNELIAKGFIVESAQGGFYGLSPLGADIRPQVLGKYKENFSKAVQGLSPETIEAALSTLVDDST